MLSTLRPWKKGQSGNPEGAGRSQRMIRETCRRAMDKYLGVLARKADGDLSFDELKQAIEMLAKFGGVVSADKAWEFAMQALANPNLAPEQGEALLALLGDRPKPDEEQGQLEAPTGDASLTP
jgi:hypothetical protein